MIKRCLLSVSLAALALALFRPSAANAEGLDGTWTAADTQGELTRVVIASDAAGRSTLQGFGRCTPECNWGSVALTSYGKSASDASASAGVAVFTTGFSSTIVTLQLTNSGTLQAGVFTRFTDGSGRKNFFMQQVLRQPLASGALSPYQRSTASRYDTSVFAKHPSPPPATGETTTNPSAPTGAGQRTILPDGSVEVTYADGTKKIYSKYGVTTITPDGKSTYRAYQNTFLAAQPPTPPTNPDNETSKWAEDEASTLLALIKTFVGNDKASIDNLLAKETEMAWYQKIDHRTYVLRTLATP